MDEVKFSDNYTDRSESTGVKAGFQFEFFCERCNDTWRTEFVPYRSGRASGWLGKAAGIFGGALGGAADAATALADSAWGQAHDETFKTAVDQAKNHFHRCARCFQYVCDKCWNTGNGLCLNCAPDAEVAIEAARSQGEVDGAVEVATEEGKRRGQKRDVKRERQLVCPKCGAETKGAKFCPDCGQALAQKTACPKCAAQLTAGAKFCPECGEKV